MKIIKGIFIIIIHLAAGNFLSYLMGGFMPGSVIGMVLMFLSLLSGVVKEDDVQEVATFLTGNMTLFFLPAFMGIMELWGVLRVNFWGWLAVVALSTVAVLASAGWVQQAVERLTGKEERK